MVKYQFRRRRINLFASETFVYTTYVFGFIYVIISCFYIMFNATDAVDQLETSYNYWSRFTSNIKDNYQEEGFNPIHSMGSNPDAYITMDEIKTLYYMIMSSSWLAANSLVMVQIVSYYSDRFKNNNPPNNNDLMIKRLLRTFQRFGCSYFYLTTFHLGFSLYNIIQMMSYTNELTPNDYYRGAALGLFSLYMIFFGYLVFWFVVMVVDIFYQKYQRHNMQQV